MPNIFNLEPPNFDVAARFHSLTEEIRNRPQDPSVLLEAARAWIEDAQLQLMWTIDDHLIAASKTLPIWLTDPDARLHIYIFGLIPTLAHYRDDIIAYLSCLMAGWGLNAQIDEHPFTIQGQITFQISIKFRTLPGYEIPSYIPLIVGDRPRQHKHLFISSKNAVALRPSTIVPRTPTSLDDFARDDSRDSTSSPPIASGSGHNALFSGDTNPLFDAPRPVTPGARHLDGDIISTSPVHKPIDLPSSGASSVFEPEPDPTTPTQQGDKTPAKNQEVRHPSPRRLYLESRAWDGGIVEPIAFKAINGGAVSLDRPNGASQDQSKFKRTIRGCKGFYVTSLLAFLAFSGLIVSQVVVGIRVGT